MTPRLLAIAIVLLTAGSAAAQDTPVPAGDGAASSSPDDVGSTRQVVLDALGSVLTGPRWNAGASIFGGYSQVNGSLASAGLFQSNPFIRSGIAAGVATHLSTSVTRRKSSFAVSGGTSTHYFRAADRFITSYQGQLSQSFALGARSSFSAGQSIGVGPYYALNQSLGLQNYAGTELAMPSQGSVATSLADTRHYQYRLSTNYAHPLTDRSRFSAHYSASGSALNAATPLMFFQMAGVRAGHSITKALGFHAGYAYSQMSFRTTGQNNGFHHLDIGLDVNRGLSITRRTKLDFRTGSVLTRTQASTSVTTTGNPTLPPPSHLRANLTGQVTIAYDLGRTWIARANYGRSWQVLDGTVVPFMGNAVNGGISGRLSKSTATGANVMYLLRNRQTSQGTSLQRGDALGVTTFVNMSISGSIAGFVQYSYYRQAIDLSQLGLSLPSAFARQSARAGLTLAFRSR